LPDTVCEFHLDLARNELQAMSAFAGVIHIQSGASVAPMQALAEDSRQIVQHRAFYRVGEKAPGAGRGVLQDALASFTRFQSDGKMRYDCDAETLDAREEAMQWLRPVTSWPIPRRRFLSERGISRPG
jgi:hypothetical protein